MLTGSGRKLDSPSACQYREWPERMIPFMDRVTRSFSLPECQRQCDSEREFTCRSINYETFAKECALSSEDLATIPRGQASLELRVNTIYSEKGVCEQVGVQCNHQDMLLTVNFDLPFNGRVYAKGNPTQCYMLGTGQTSLQFAISLGARCGTTEEGPTRFVNEVVIQQHPVIVTDNDKTIRVICSFETSDRTVTLAQGIGGVPGFDVTTRLQPTLASLVTNTAPPPNVVMRILDRSGRDATVVGLGDELTLRLELRQPTTSLALFARNLYARSKNGESLFLIDSIGCPTDLSIFPALSLDLRDRRTLYANFKAFRFPSTGLVNFEVQIRFCQERCQPVRCANGLDSYGKRKRRNAERISNETEVMSAEGNISPILVPQSAIVEDLLVSGKQRHKGQMISYDKDEKSQGQSSIAYTPKEVTITTPLTTAHSFHTGMENGTTTEMSSTMALDRDYSKGQPLNNNVTLNTTHASDVSSYESSDETISAFPLDHHYSTTDDVFLLWTASGDSSTDTEDERIMEASDIGQIAKVSSSDRNRRRHYELTTLPMLLSPTAEYIAAAPQKASRDIPLSLAIMVGDDNTEKANWSPEYGTREGVEAVRPSSDIVCASQSTIIATVASVTLLHVAIAVGAFFCYRWHRKNKRKKQYEEQISFPKPSGNSDIMFGSPDVNFSAIYGCYETPP